MGWCAGGALAIAGCAGAALAGWNDQYAVVLVTSPLVLGISPLVRVIHLRRLRSAARYRAVTDNPVAGELLEALKATGLHRLDVRTGAKVKGIARSLRAGRSGVVVIDELVLARPAGARFFLAHEAAHLARYDSLRRPATDVCALACLCYAGTGWPPAYLAIVPLIVAAACRNHAMELDCDRIATQWAGLDAAERTMAWLVSLDRNRRLTPARRFRRLLTYPEPAHRLTAVREAAKATGQSPAQAEP